MFVAPPTWTQECCVPLRRCKSMAAFASQTTWLPPPDAPLATAPLSRFLRVPDPELETIHDALWDLKQALALQCVFLAGCCSRARAAATNVTSSGKLGALLGGAEAASSAVTVGIIGGGIIGGVVAHALLDAGAPPSTVVMSTRSPRRQEDLAARGVAVVFDNALVASKAHLLIIAVLPAQLHDVAKSMRPAPHALVLSLVGATPLAKVRQIFDSPHAVASSADATLPLIMQAQASLASVAAGGVHVDGLVAGRLPPEKLLELAAAGFVRFARCLEAPLPAEHPAVRSSSLTFPTPLLAVAGFQRAEPRATRARAARRSWRPRASTRGHSQDCDRSPLWPAASRRAHRGLGGARRHR